MTTNLTTARIGGTLALALILAASALGGTARAGDDYNTDHETVIRAAAMSAGRGTASQAREPSLASGRNDNFGASGQESVIRQSAASILPTAPVNLARAQDSMGYYASDGSFRVSASLVDGSKDILGSGGHQDELAREIYRPGTTVGF